MKINELKEKTKDELKVIVYDLLVEQQVVNNSLQIVNNLIAEKDKGAKLNIEESEEKAEDESEESSE